jgi:hypothetical protein
MKFYVNRHIAKRGSNSLVGFFLKKENSHGLCDYKPISLIGFVYKVLAV